LRCANARSGPSARQPPTAVECLPSVRPEGTNCNASTTGAGKAAATPCPSVRVVRRRTVVQISGRAHSLPRRQQAKMAVTRPPERATSRCPSRTLSSRATGGIHGALYAFYTESTYKDEEDGVRRQKGRCRSPQPSSPANQKESHGGPVTVKSAPEKVKVGSTDYSRIPADRRPQPAATVVRYGT